MTGQNNKKGYCSGVNFMKCRPPEFSSSFDLTMCLRWLREMEQTFDCCDCDEEHKVMYAAYMLKGSASCWWHMVCESRGESIVNQLTWEAFKDKVKSFYCTEGEIFAIENEFLNLKKGNMSIEQYANLFVEKLSFSGRMARNEESKVRCFVRGLPSDYWLFVRNMTTLNAAIQEAKMIENDLALEQEEKRVVVGSSKKFNLVKEDNCMKRDTYIMEEEFLNLKKGDMTIGQYANLFVEKLRFAGRLAPDEESKVNRFVRGLPSSYRAYVRNMDTLDAAIEEAKMVEDFLVRKETENKRGYE